MPKKKQVVAYRCVREDAFWAYAEAKGFAIDFVDSEAELVQAIKSSRCGVIVTTDSSGWNEAVRAVPGVSAGPAVFLLPLSSRRVHVVDVETNKAIPGPVTYYELVEVLDEACLKCSSQSRQDPGGDLRERLNGLLRGSDRSRAEKQTWLESTRRELEKFVAILEGEAPEVSGFLKQGAAPGRHASGSGC